MIGIKFFLLGYFLISVNEEEKSAFARALFDRSIPMKGLKDGRIVILQKYKKQVLNVCLGVDFCTSENKGLPGFIYRNRKRYGAFAGALICLFLFFLSANRIWDIRIFGADETVAEEVENALFSQGVRAGIRFHSVDFSEVESKLKIACPSIGWVNVHRRGTVLYLNLIESETGAPSPPSELCNIVASEDCVITAVLPSAGVATVKVGEAVRKGELLIAAVHPDGTVSGASGTVMGLVSGSATGACERETVKRITEKERVCAAELTFFNFSLNIFKNYGNLKINCDIIEETRQLRLFGRFPLPIFLRVFTAYASHEQITRYSDADMVHIASISLKNSLSEILSMGDLQSIRTVGEWTDGGYKMTAEYVQIRSVGTSVPIRLEGKS